MKPTLPLFFLLLGGTAANAQFLLTPQAGFEQSRTSLAYGNALSAAGANGVFKAGLKAEYRLRTGHTPFVNAATSPAPVSFAFDNAGSLVKSFRQNKLQWRLEAGYGYTSNPISLGKKSTAAKSKTTNALTEGDLQRQSCQKTARLHCGQKSRLPKAALANNNTLNLRLQPSVALAYIPSETESIKPTASGFEYAGAAWKTAVVPALGFEFAKGSQRLFSVNVFYTKPLGQDAETATIASGAKTISVPLQPRTSTWGMTVGVPLSFAKAAAPKSTRQKKECRRTEYRTEYRKCGRLQ